MYATSKELLDAPGLDEFDKAAQRAVKVSQALRELAKVASALGDGKTRDLLLHAQEYACAGLSQLSAVKHYDFVESDPDDADETGSQDPEEAFTSADSCILEAERRHNQLKSVLEQKGALSLVPTLAALGDNRSRA